MQAAGRAPGGLCAGIGQVRTRQRQDDGGQGVQVQGEGVPRRPAHQHHSRQHEDRDLRRRCEESSCPSGCQLCNHRQVFVFANSTKHLWTRDSRFVGTGGQMYGRSLVQCVWGQLAQTRMLTGTCASGPESDTKA
jgi:hypothetical protein